MLNLSFFTANPSLFPASLGVSIFQKAMQDKIFCIDTINIKNFSPKQNNRIDDYPFGGGAGMVIGADVFQRAFDNHYQTRQYNNTKPLIIYPSAKGILFNSNIAKSIATKLQKDKHLAFICGRFEGVDQRFIEQNNVLEISLGSFILAGGDVAAMAMCESILRFIPSIIGNKNTHDQESYQMNISINISQALILQLIKELVDENKIPQDINFHDSIINKIILHLQNSENIVEYSHYTRPAIWQNINVPDVLISGNHKNIGEYRQRNAIKNTIYKLLTDLQIIPIHQLQD